MASDRGTPPRKKDHILQVTILDVNDNPPVIESPFGYNVSVNEVRAASAPVQTSRVGSEHEPTTKHLFDVAAWPTGLSDLRDGNSGLFIILVLTPGLGPGVQYLFVVAVRGRGEGRERRKWPSTTNSEQVYPGRAVFK